ncbi:MAG: hypothetical protein GX240_04945 [Candidatus Atribacteria bacterium]|nr:hypothetical protein [Candidatus Atribacteria bacterium]
MKKYPFVFKKLIVIFICFSTPFFICTCQQYPFISYHNADDHSNSAVEGDSGTKNFLSIKGSPDIIKDCTPEMEILVEEDDIEYMSFSGNGEDWSEWIRFSKKYDQFNIANGYFGTVRTSGIKNIFVRFKDEAGNILPAEGQNPFYCTVNYEMQELFSIAVVPIEATLRVGEKLSFIVKGYDLFSVNEVPLDEKLTVWSKPCMVGELVPEVGLETIYTAPESPGLRNIRVQYNSLTAGARINVIR